MSYRKIPKNKVLKFPATPGFKGWKDHFTDESVAHPAKMNLNLLRHILKTYTRPGDVVLDPMAGTGSTVVLASLLGRHGIAVELEPHFVGMIRENIKRSERHSTLTPKGSMSCIQGDARELSKLLGGSDTMAIISSPPYGEAQSGGGIAVKGYDGPKHGPTDLVGERSYMPDKFEEEDNIGVLKYGDVDTVIISPPYEASFSKKNQEMKRLLRLYHEGKLKGNIKRRVGEWIRNPDKNLGFAGGQEVSYTKNIDAIVASPPYGNRLADDVVQDGDEARMSYRQAVDSIVISPPFERTISSKSGGPMDPDEKASLKRMREYSEDPENIGNLKTDSYLSAMLEVYCECFKVGGKLILVTKNFIRNKQVVRLDLDTIKLCEAAGFHLSDRWYFKIPSKSFWRIIYSQKYPDVPEVKYEDVLIFGKESEK